MNPLPPQDAARVLAAQECLKTGNPAGAANAIAELDPASLEHPDALEIRWELAAQAGEWEPALKIAQLLCQLSPENEFAWLGHACSLHELGHPDQAFSTLLTAHNHLPKAPTIAYNLACGACKLRRFDEAYRWILKAVELGGRAEVKLMALSDPDLAPLLDRICALQ